MYVRGQSWRQPFSPCGNISQVTPGQAQEALINVFQRWGMPQSIRVDNGKPLGDPQRKSIPAIALWLEGLKVQVIYNRPRRPTDNAKVERMQRTTQNWAEVNHCKDIHQLRQRLKEACLIQREVFKVSRLKNKTRLQTFPQLTQNSRRYDPAYFDIQCAYSRLEKWKFVRKTSKIGQFTLYAKVYYLGADYAKQHVCVEFDRENIEWKVKDSQGNFITSFDATTLDKTNIWNLTVGQRTKK